MEIVDMAGRWVQLPERILRIHAPQPYTQVLAHMVAPEMLIGHQPILRRALDRRWLRPEMLDLPGLSAADDPERIRQLKPDIVLLKGNGRSDLGDLLELHAHLGLPLVCVDLDEIDAYPAALEFLGGLVGKGERGRQLADHARQVLARVDQVVARVPLAERLRVYYAESADGLSTECDESFHADAIKRAGGVIVHRGRPSQHMGMERVTLEQVLAYDPDVIVSADPGFARMAREDSRWQQLRAVFQGRVWSIPHSPYNWLDRPPSVMRIAGMQWLAGRLYPGAYRTDLGVELKLFHQQFLGVTPEADELSAWLQ